MTNLVVKNEIIKYRSLGYSYSDIAELVKLSKPTIIKTCKACEPEISTAKRVASLQAEDDLVEALRKRKTIYNSLLSKIAREMMSRDLSSVKTRDLALVVGTLERSLKALEDGKNTGTVDAFSKLSDEELAVIIGEVTYKAKG